MLKPLLAAIFALTTITYAQAQGHFGLRAGYNAAWFTGQLDYQPQQRYHLEHGLQVGLTYTQPFGRLAVQPALLFTHQGSRATMREEQTTSQGPYVREYRQRFRLNYVALQLPVVYTPSENHGWQLFAGPYVARGVSGKFDGNFQATLNGAPIETWGGTGGVRFATDGSSYYTSVSPWDAGLLGGVGYRRGPVQVQAGYSHGFLNRLTKTIASPSDWQEHQRSVFLTLTYFLGRP
ncbi:outer membrane beta-barrel protein [Hymenobacter sp. CRA2]|uniref:outer membrane beta-barrel protein n=1 Tax=Hymenobacter sp. CRA2 TaxID=1955620 RepID=UPI00098F3F02|nr:outer membrane beta-barrel protein [Hymenobacter sp. CRA2]OON66208.1 hypothetical protein B0919_22225 [Hymenobacter sp. CRA2]